MENSLTVAKTRDEWIPLFSYIRIRGYLGYWFFLDTWIIGYLDIMHTWIHGYLDTWISVFFGYMDTWILWISNFFIIQILDILSRFWISYPSIRIFLDTFLKLPYVGKRHSNSSVVCLLCLLIRFILWVSKYRKFLDWTNCWIPDFLAFKSGVLQGDLSCFIIFLVISHKWLD